VNQRPALVSISLLCQLPRTLNGNAEQNGDRSSPRKPASDQGLLALALPPFSTRLSPQDL
jgi:hypothetical protein